MPASEIQAHHDAFRAFEAAHVQCVDAITAMKGAQAVAAAETVSRQESLDRLPMAWDALSEAERAGLVLQLQE